MSRSWHYNETRSKQRLFFLILKGKTIDAGDASTLDDIHSPELEAEEHFPRGNVLRDIWNLFANPGVLFADLTVQNRSAQALVILLVLQLLYAWTLLSTGVPDFEIDTATQREISRQYRELEGTDTEDTLTAALNSIEKNAVFVKMLLKVQLFAGPPARLITAACLVSGILFAAVALRGGKPNYPLLAGIVIFAAYTDVPRMLLKLVLVSQLQASRVDTSLAALYPPAPGADIGYYLLLRRLDPFEIWFWILVGYGVWKTGQLEARTTFVLVTLFAMVTAVFNMGWDVPDLAILPKMETQSIGPPGKPGRG